MSSDNNNPPTETMGRQQRRSSVTQAAFSNLFRSNSVSQGPAFPSAIPASGAVNDRRRLSITTLGLSTSSPTTATPFGVRRSSLSTNNSDSIDENAVEDDEGGTARTAPTTPFARRMSFGAQAMLNMRGSGTSPGSSNDQGFNWSEQLRSRAESSVTGPRPSFSFGSSGLSSSPPRGPTTNQTPGHHDRAKSVSDMPAPPAQAPKPRQPQKPDHFQERILKGDFYMD